MRSPVEAVTSASGVTNVMLPVIHTSAINDSAVPVVVNRDERSMG